MVEIHSHILPMFDDGAQSKDEALKMGLQAFEQGITHIVATPHHGNGVYEAQYNAVLEAVEELNRLFSARDLPVTVHVGQEIRVNAGIIDEWEQGGLLTLANSRYMLLELPNGYVPDYFEDLLYELAIRDVVPVIAHPERNKEVVESPSIIERWIEQGALCQLTAHSLIGVFGHKIQKLSRQLCRRRMIHLISSDAHNCHNRTFAIREAYREAERVAGRDWASTIRENARRLLANEAIDLEAPVKAKRSLLFWSL